MIERTGLRRPPLAGNESRYASALLALALVLVLLVFRPGPADVIPLGGAPDVMQPPPATETTAAAPGPRTGGASIYNVETGPWLTAGANAAHAEAITTPLTISPEPNWASFGQGCAADEYAVPHCYEFRPADGVTTDRQILTVGNSHSVQFSAGLMEVLDRRPNWSIRAMAAPGCAFTYVATPKSDCEQVWSTATEYILDRQPDMVVVLATRSNAHGPENLLPGLAAWIKMIEDSTTSEVVAIRDTPRFDFDIHNCAVDNGTGSSACKVHDATQPLPEHEAALEQAGATYIDITNLICPRRTCQPVLGGLWTYLDDNHPSADFWRSLAGYLSMRINADPHLEWWPRDAYLGNVIDRPRNEVKPVT